MVVPLRPLQYLLTSRDTPCMQCFSALKRCKILLLQSTDKSSVLYRDYSDASRFSMYATAAYMALRKLSANSKLYIVFVTFNVCSRSFKDKIENGKKV